MLRFFLIIFLLVSFAPLPAGAQQTPAVPTTQANEKAVEDKPEEKKPLIAAPYDSKLLRLSEVLGSIHYLRALCGANEGAKWRDHMAELITVEKPDETRKKRLIGRFNRGFYAFEQIYRTCTPSALLAADRYMKEGVLLSSQITSRYGR